MVLLFITRKIDKNDTLAGFTYQWVKKFAAKVDALNVICLEKGDIFGLPENVKIYSLRKERGAGKLMKFWNFQKYAFQLVKKSNAVFCHQNPIYTILIAPWAKLYGKKIITWYTHGKVGLQLRLVNLLADVILTASPESFRLPSKKVIVTGHGIDIAAFQPRTQNSKLKTQNLFKILSIGRISPIKNYETLIEALDILVNQKNFKNIKADIIGAPGLKEQAVYLEKLKKMVVDKNLTGYVKFLGSKPYPESPRYYQDCDLFVNLSRTGSVDKAVLEAMACGKLVLTSNEAFVNILKDKGAELMVKPESPDELAEKIVAMTRLDEETRAAIGLKLREEVVKNHNLDILAEKIINIINKGMKLFYIANSRIPTEKAHGIQIMKMLEAFSLSELKTQNSTFVPSSGRGKLKTANQNQKKIEIELVVPRRFNPIKQDPFEYYGTKKNFKIKKLPCLDLIPLGLPKIGFWIQAATFGLLATVYLFFKSKPEDIIYSRDEFSLWFLSFLGRNIFWEAHVFPGSPRKYQRILKKIKGFVVISHGLKKSFSPCGRSPEGRQAVGMPEEKILVAPDAVDLTRFDVKETKEECRKKLGLPLNTKIVIYTGHLYAWKGANTLSETACNFQFLSLREIWQSQTISNFQTLFVFVGGTEEDVESYRLKTANCENVIFVGHRPHKEIPVWLKAADVLVLPNSAKEKISAIYTSPLKLFEYMAAGKPIVASDLPSLREILNKNNAVLVEPDNPEALAKGIEKVLKDSVLAEKIAQNAAEEAKNYTWEKRAQNILTFISNKAIIK